MTPEEVFRFVNVRPVQRAPKARVARRFSAYGDGDKKTLLHREIEQLPKEGARAAAVELAKRRLAIADDLSELAAMVKAVGKASAEHSVAKARDLVKKELGLAPDAFLKGEPARKLKDALWDRMYAHTLVPEESPEDREEILDGLRAMHFLEYLAVQQGTDVPLSLNELALVRPTIPRAVVAPSPAGDVGWQEAYLKRVAETLGGVQAHLLALNKAIGDLKNNERGYQEGLRRTVVDLPVAELQRPRAVRLSGPTMWPPGVALETDVAGGAGGSAPTNEQRNIIVPKRPPWIFEGYGQANLSAETRATLAARRSDLLELEFAQVVALLEREKHTLVAGFMAVLPRAALPHIRATPEFEYLVANVALDYPAALLAPALAVPAQPGTAAARGIQPLGVGDLLVVRQDIRRYEAGELAHVENVLKSESKKRRHSRLREVEETLVTETERTEESEKDLQTTERFELQKESEKTIENQMSLEAGLAVSASYGPVSVTAHADFALSQSSSEASRTASTFAKQVTERSVARIRARTREERTRRTLERFEEVNEHGFDNTGAGAQNVTGIYRWLDKYYRARLINYGRRMMIEFIVPEPAAFFLAVGKQPLKGITLEKPTEPQVWGRRLRPDDLSKSNYNGWVAKYNVQDVESYPDEVVRVSAAVAEAAQTEGVNIAYAKTSEKLVVPDGYECEDVYGAFSWQGVSGTGHFAECFIAGQRWGSITAAGLQGIIPISVKGWLRAFHVNVVAVCRIKPESTAKWQAKMYEAIMNAYERALADYNEQVAAAQIQSGVDIQGRNPEINRRIEKDELKKGVLRLLTNDFAKTRVGGAWRFNELFDAMSSNGPAGYPDFDVAEAIVEGRIIQFFEQALEWTNMTYRFYPYYWGRKSRWGETFPLSDPDTPFVDFLRAGSARVVVPVHPNYDETVLHYLATDEIWNGGTPPTLYDPLYISIVDELKADTGGDLDKATACQPGKGYPCLVDEWEVKVPTDLVYLEKGADLPKFGP